MRKHHFTANRLAHGDSPLRAHNGPITIVIATKGLWAAELDALEALDLMYVDMNIIS
jgi:hypothetical protein